MADDLYDFELQGDILEQYSQLNASDSVSLIDGDPTTARPFCPQDADSVASALGKCFRVFYPGDYVCKGNIDSSTSFVHCSHSIRLTEKYSELRLTLERRALLQLARDCHARLDTAHRFVRQMTSFAREELSCLRGLQCGDLDPGDVTRTRILELNVICDDLRIHVSHWNSLKQRLHTDRWLRTRLPRLSVELDAVRGMLEHLSSAALWWIDQIVQAGLEVLGHSDKSSLSDRDLWSVVRGVEEFDAVLALVREKQLGVPTSSHGASDGVSPARRPLSTRGLHRCLSHGIKPVTFSRVLHKLAANESQQLALVLYKSLARRGLLPGSADWSVLSGPKQVPNAGLTGNDTSDYGTMSGESQENSLGPTGQADRASRTPVSNKSFDATPFNDLVQKESDFIKRLVNVTCQGTNLLKSQQKVSHHQADLHKPPPLKSDSRSSDPLRKSVTWRDSSNGVISSQLNDRYLDLVGHQMVNHFTNHLLGHVWGSGSATPAGRQWGSGSATLASRECLGSICLCPDPLVRGLTDWIKAMICTGSLPSSVDASLNRVCGSILISVATRHWDTEMCGALSSAFRGDSRSPVPLTGGLACTRTANQLRQALEDIATMLRGVHLPGQSSAGVGVTVESLVPHVLTTCHSSFAWLQRSATHALSAKNWRQFLLLAQGDAQLLSDRTSELMSGLLAHSDGTASRVAPSKLDSIGRVSHSVALLQGLSGSLMTSFVSEYRRVASDFFGGALPLGRVWRRRSRRDAVPCTPNSYSCQVADKLLRPTLRGIEHLSTASQLTTVSLVTGATYEVWMETILEEKIKFSIHGANQLGEDFSRVRSDLIELLDSPDLNVSAKVKDTVKALEVFQHCTTVIALLRRQPESESADRNQPVESGVARVGSLVRHNSRESSSSEGTTPFSCSKCHSDHETVASCPGDRTVARREEWLALRVHGGTKQWLPSCLRRD